MPAWKAAAAKYERFDLQTWTIGDLPESIDLSRPGALPLEPIPPWCWKQTISTSNSCPVRRKPRSEPSSMALTGRTLLESRLRLDAT